MELNYETNPNRLLIVSRSQKQASFFISQIKAVLGNSIGLTAWIKEYEDIAQLYALLAYKPQHIIGSSLESVAFVQQHYDADKISVADLYLHRPSCIDQLFLIPQGKQVLVVNKTERTAHQVIRSLVEMNINHIEYEPYWENCSSDVSAYDTAISPDMLDYCPEFIQNKINIGMRGLAVSNFSKIIETYNLGNNNINNYVNIQTSFLIDIYKELSSRFMDIQHMKNTMDSILDGLGEAVVSLDKRNHITTINKVATNLFQTKGKPMTGKHAKELFISIPELEHIDDIKKLNNIITIKKQSFYIAYYPLDLEKLTGTVGIIRLTETGYIQTNDSQVRKLLYQKNNGHVAKYTLDDIFANDSVTIHLKDTVKSLSSTDYTVLITGESGTGKELFSSAIHNTSKRRDKPFVAVNFAALPENLIESELFGYVDGAFTGARKQGKMGLFELAHTGTIFLDEIGDASPAVQTRLLRVLEEKEIVRMGDTNIIPVDVRVIVATNKNLKKLVEKGTFRADLYYRINVFQLIIPPLRERLNAIIPFICMISNNQLSEQSFTKDTITALLEYQWPGNVRELRNLVDYISIMVNGRKVCTEDLPIDIKSCYKKQNTEKHTDFETLYYRLQSNWDITLIQTTLEVIFENRKKTKVAGRNTIQQILEAKGFPCSTSTLRTLLTYMESYQMLVIGKTKQGTQLSEFGEQFLFWLRSNVHK